MIPQTTELSQIQAAFIDKDNRIEELMRQINSAQSLLNSLKDTMNSLVGDGKITIQTYAGSNVGDFTVNQKEDKTITLPQQPTVNNGTLTIQKNGTSVGTFTANQSEDTTADIIDNSLQFTYVVDNDQKLADWVDNVAGNDYTSVLVKGDRSITRNTVINLNNIRTKIIVGETGSSLTIYGNNTDLFSYNSLPLDDNYLIANLNIKLYMTVKNGNTRNGLFLRCRNIRNCNITIYPQSEFSNPKYIYAFHSCKNISDTSIQLDFTNTVYSRILLLYNCNNIYNITTTTGTIPANVTNVKIIDSSFIIRDCNIAGDTSGNVIGISNSYLCYANSLTNASYQSSYSSPTARTEYKCADTLNGGFNKVGDEDCKAAIYPAFTYVVDSNQALTDWANNVAGNDYTSVLIKKGEYTFSGTNGINLTTTNTKTITGETGSILYFNISTNQEAAMYYDNIPESNDYYIKNVTIKAIRHDNHCLKNCINIYNCVLLAADSSVAIMYCNNIVDSMISGTYAASHCIGIVNCIAYKGSGNILYQRGFNDSYSMLKCKVKDSISAPFYGSYSSPTADSTYACANTLNGGWNTTA